MEQYRIDAGRHLGPVVLIHEASNASQQGILVDYTRCYANAERLVHVFNELSAARIAPPDVREVRPDLGVGHDPDIDAVQLLQNPAPLMPGRQLVRLDAPAAFDFSILAFHV